MSPFWLVALLVLMGGAGVVARLLAEIVRCAEDLRVAVARAADLRNATDPVRTATVRAGHTFAGLGRR